MGCTGRCYWLWRGLGRLCGVGVAQPRAAVAITIEYEEPASQQTQHTSVTNEDESSIESEAGLRADGMTSGSFRSSTLEWWGVFQFRWPAAAAAGRPCAGDSRAAAQAAVATPEVEQQEQESAESVVAAAVGEGQLLICSGQRENLRVMTGL